MTSKLATFFAALGVMATVGMTLLPLEASAQSRKCYRGTGGVYTCY
jgi:hypothetical protein